MNRVAIFVVPSGASQSDFEDAIRDSFALAQIVETRLALETDQATLRDPDESPLWTWFVPNRSS